MNKIKPWEERYAEASPKEHIQYYKDAEIADHRASRLIEDQLKAAAPNFDQVYDAAPPHLRGYYAIAEYFFTTGRNMQGPATQSEAQSAPVSLSDYRAINSDWNKLMDALGCEDTQSALMVIAKLQSAPGAGADDSTGNYANWSADKSAAFVLGTAAPIAEQEPVYQIAVDCTSMLWKDATKEQFDAHTNTTHRRKRIFYTAPPAPTAASLRHSETHVSDLEDSLQQIADAVGVEKNKGADALIAAVRKMAAQQAGSELPTESQIEAAIDAYDAAWNPANRGHGNKVEAMTAALAAARQAPPTQGGV